jgi:pimeloyl-ACP methyl ester carboxylesterase
LKAGFDWYRAFDADAKMNREPSGRSMATPLLYLRGEHESGDIGRYVQGFKGSGMVHVESGIVPGAGHFTQEEAPQEVWRIISRFIGDRTRAVEND